MTLRWQLTRNLTAVCRDRLPAETLSAEQQRDAFASKGLLPREMVAILGAHTVRTARGVSLLVHHVLLKSLPQQVCMPRWCKAFRLNAFRLCTE